MSTARRIAQIESLLREPVRDQLSPVPDRAPVLGTVSVARPIAGPPRTGGAAPPNAAFLMEHGWFAQSTSDIYTWGALATYYAGTPGVLLYYAADASGVFRGNPSLGADGEFMTRGWRAAKAATAARYSGLTRLFAQALGGAKRNDRIASIEQFVTKLLAKLPSSVQLGPIPVGPGSLGVVRSPAGRYWLILATDTPGTASDGYTHAGGMWAVELIPHGALSALGAELIAGSFVGLEAQLVESFLLGYATPKMVDGEVSVIPLLLAADGDVAAMYAAPDALDPTTVGSDLYGTQVVTNIPMHKAHWGWGWVFTFQHRGAADEHSPQAVCTLAKAEEGTRDFFGTFICWVIRVAVATFSFSPATGAPAVTLSFEPDKAAATSAANSQIVLTRGGMLVDQPNAGAETFGWAPAKTLPHTYYAQNQPQMVGQDKAGYNTLLAWFDATGAIERFSCRSRMDNLTGTETATYYSGTWAEYPGQSIPATFIDRTTYGGYQQVGFSIGTPPDDSTAEITRFRIHVIAGGGAYDDDIFGQTFGQTQSRQVGVISDCPGVAWIITTEPVTKTSQIYQDRRPYWEDHSQPSPVVEVTDEPKPKTTSGHAVAETGGDARAYLGDLAIRVVAWLGTGPKPPDILRSVAAYGIEGNVVGAATEPGVSNVGAGQSGVWIGSA